MRNESKDVAIKDPKGNTIRQWMNLKDSTQGGVDELYFQLADHVLTGDWLITVTIKSIEESLIFTVDNYVLPTFEVELDTPSFGLSTDATLDFTVRARYTFGRPVTQAGVKVNIKLFYDFLTPDTGGAFLTLTGQVIFVIFPNDW
ncbi:CD109 antigen-like [Physella acuta]|uniref:CD109 antigen-like n=1 Tax=Physella acuta TaxID=109671 RepID=UPI0027DE02D5|nr:CD109 antigen-like [Physella acuta]